MQNIDPSFSSAPHPILVTGSAGFIGANFVLEWMKKGLSPVISLDKLTYAGNRQNLASLDNNPKHLFVQGDIGDRALVEKLLNAYHPRAIVNFAAETHVDRSIHAPEDFVQTNVVGTFRLLDASRVYWNDLPETEKKAFRFLHVSTDEVYGSLLPEDPAFSETNCYQPNSPYSAAKAGSDHMVRAYHHTYGLPTLTTNCSNNYGPYQFPEKLIPLVLLNAMKGAALPIYGDGQNIRDWLYVGDHCSAIRSVLADGKPGQTYNIGGHNEIRNIDIVHIICDLLDREKPRADGRSYREQITFVKDRPGHDRRYAIDAEKIKKELGWVPQETFETGIAQTIRWYLDNSEWIEGVTSGSYRQWIQTNYQSGERASS